MFPAANQVLVARVVGSKTVGRSRGNKVFVKPIKSGAATDLFVWTASRPFAYELEITQEVKDITFAIDTAQPALATAPKPVVETDTDQFANLVLTRALIEEIKQKSPRKAKGQVSVRVKEVFRTRSSVYIHYTIENNSGLSYRVNPPEVYRLQMVDSPVSLATFAHTQLDRAMFEELEDTKKQELALL